MVWASEFSGIARALGLQHHPTPQAGRASILGDLASHLLIGLVSGALSAWLTYVFALRRFRTEKWWERRADAYEKIMDALHTAKRFSYVHLKRLVHDSEPAPEEENELREQSKDAHNYILRAIDIGRLILPDEALHRLTEYLKEDAQNTSDDWNHYLNNDYDIVSRCLSDITEIARKDLQAHP